MTVWIRFISLTVVLGSGVSSGVAEAPAPVVKSLASLVVQFSKPLTVMTNGRLSFEGTLTQSVETLLRQAGLRQDPERLFSVHLTIVMAKQAS